ncbi:MAG: hypothetical protein ACTSQI_16655 [Candidatus Helarchaeota archaeon]
MTERNEYGERINPRIYMGSKIVGYLFLISAVILVVQAVLSLLSVYGIIQVMPFSEYLSGPSWIVEAFEGFFLMTVITSFAFAAIAIVCYIGILREQEWAGGIALILMGLVAFTMVMHLIINPGLFGSLNMVLEICVFAIALLSTTYIIKNFKRFD